MILEDLIEGFKARAQVYILQNQIKVCRAEKNFLFLTIGSYERDNKSLQTIIDNQIEEKELQAMVTQNIVKVEKTKKKKWVLVAIAEGALIILILIIVK